jgi:hypothetical protein
VSEARCEHDLLVSQCGYCRPPATGLPAELRLGPWFTAGYAGRCSMGDERIEPGDTIRADGEGGYLCEPCGSEHP